jgi:hypothetical protein
MGEKRRQWNETAVWMFIQFLSLVVGQNQSYAESFPDWCTWDGCRAAIREARENNRLREGHQKPLRHLQTKACSENSCLYRMKPIAVHQKGWHGLQSSYYAGSGFKFFDDSNLLDDQDDARLVDPQGRTTILGYRIGDHDGYYTYIRGPLKGARIEMHKGDYVLTVSK